ncbi:response regulator transcription factor [Salinisphaera sp. Q1T1-3]|uniref:response regulator transcription factor n=1 Tax=Salinisphaera sp. Q1T1-3 TaxID=2321229 RepID=UPI000E7367A4|nr:response regulator [Salinisphaera sp. Q1T1-3]RJS92404.1 DNA-binding response regulator [Salinisphaera sp. Q1T1-3]
MDALVHIVDDDDAVRDSLRCLLETIPVDCAEYASGHAFVDRSRTPHSGCVLLDLRIPDMSGLAVQRAICQTDPHLPIIFMSGYGDVAATVEAMRGGAVHFLEKPVDDDLLIATVREAIDDSQAMMAERRQSDEARARLGRLTPREVDVMDEVVAGWSNKHIARRLDISPKTVELHRANVMHKMSAGSLAELVRLHLTATGASPTAMENRGPARP